jgi:hypothetical protein
LLNFDMIDISNAANSYLKVLCLIPRQLTASASAARSLATKSEMSGNQLIGGSDINNFVKSGLCAPAEAQ